ncbi:MAG: glycosyltransferase [Sphaerospermopsis sp. SIO1G2]|nr:glycosyltransferase [Sphaerospermopsis sp. SIO1G2]
MKILFLHQNMPGQYKHLCQAFAKDPNNQVVFLTKPKNFDIPGVYKVEYKVPREPSASTHRYIVGAERAVLAGQEVWRVCAKLKKEEGFIPDVICTHPGWGDALYLKDIYPDTPILSFLEFFYHAQGADVGFDKDRLIDGDERARIRSKNITNLLSLDSMDWGICPTLWQASLHPDVYKPSISVLHDGVDTDMCRPNAQAELTITGTTYRPGDEVVTYIARNFEPYRGFPTFMRAAEIILKQRPNCHILAVGADEVSYGHRLSKGNTWRHRMMQEVDLDTSRIFFPGVMSYHQLITLFQVSAAHIYLTYPFVLSWSSMEAMAAGCAMVSSATYPVQEVMTHEHNALLADFFDHEQVAEHVIRVLESKDHMADMRVAARQTILDHYALQDVLPLHQQLIIDLAEKRTPPPTHEVIMQRHAHSSFPYLLQEAA